MDKVFVGGWFQRTALHLSEFHDFVLGEETPLDLDPKEIQKYRRALDIEHVEKKFDGLEYIHIHTKKGIDLQVFEDGLIVLSFPPQMNGKKTIQLLTNYYEKKLSPAFSYIFSLGAPVPKELANIKNVYPYFLVLDNASVEQIDELFTAYKEPRQFDIESETFNIHRGDKLYVINRKTESIENVARFIQEQIFLREFRGQMHRYLNLHRIIWERIAEVKERGTIRGKSIGAFKTKIEEYKKTITLIDTRIDQMGTYIHTRERIAKGSPALQEFQNVIEYRYETLSNTLSYVKDIWTMTMRYVDSALDLFKDLQSQSTNSSVQNLTVVTSMGVGATLLGLFTADSVPAFTVFGVAYFFILAAIGYGANRVMRAIYRNRDYEVSDTRINTDIK